MNRGFTLIELLVSIAIFAIMTALVVAKYGNFNQSTLLTDTAYDVALAVRTAQTYGLSVKNASQAGSQFNYPYGVEFVEKPTSSQCAGINPDGTVIILYGNSNGGFACNTNDTLVSKYTLTRGAHISRLCASSVNGTCSGDINNNGNGNSNNSLSIVFLRPNPDAIFCVNGNCNKNTYVQIDVTSSDGNNTRTISVWQNGQISVSH
ncbi:MAG: type II secretion system protein [Patescibacteria group bacterium]|nr:type II secretion system protein [Patescibacteria group bacterium]